MDSIYRGPMHSSLMTLVEGLVTYRSYSKIGHF
jgi:hypothetical protein